MTTRVTQAIRREKRENFGYPHPRNLIRENPDWALNREIYIPRKIPGIRYTISYAFNIALLIVIIAITTTERLFECICLLSRMLQNLGLCVLLGVLLTFWSIPIMTHYRWS